MKFSDEEVLGRYCVNAPVVLILAESLTDIPFVLMKAVADLGCACYAAPWYAAEPEKRHLCRISDGAVWTVDHPSELKESVILKPSLIWAHCPLRGEAERIAMTLKQNAPDALFNYGPAVRQALEHIPETNGIYLIERLFPLTIGSIDKSASEDENPGSNTFDEIRRLLHIESLRESPHSHQLIIALPHKERWYQDENKVKAVFSRILCRLHMPARIFLPKAAATNGEAKTTPGKTDPSPDAFVHPYAWLHPVIGRNFCLANTVAWPDARWQYKDEGLRMCGNESNGHSMDSALLAHLGRVISDDPCVDPAAQRYVEPGVGRTVLLTGIEFGEDSPFSDFSATGVGLTPYSKEGFAMVGPYVDGLTSIKRALHRKDCADRLAEAGCRVAKMAAIIALPGLETTMPDYTKEPAAIVIRGFRSVFRVKQLDPLACLYLSPQHRPYISQLISEDRFAAKANRDEPDSEDNTRMIGLSFSSTSNSLRSIVGSLTLPRARYTPPVQTFIGRRRRIIDTYSPILVRHGRLKVSQELGLDPEKEIISNTEYAHWFCRELGRQLGIMKKLRFLHDYHHTGTLRATDNWIYTLCETNVSLLAEFPDLDTAIFTDKEDSETLDRLRLTNAEFENLRTNFEKFHLTDVREAEKVAMTLCQIVLHFDQEAVDEALYKFSTSYDQTIRKLYL